MNERERWIVYPLLFFALGASLRDKFMQQVSTKELHCQRVVAKEVICEDVSVIDAEKPDRIVAQLTSGRPGGPAGKASDRFGVLLLRDSEGKELCGVTNNQLQVRTINCEGVRILDPSNQNRILAGLGSVTVAGDKGKARPFGVLVLNNEDFGTVTGNPPRDVVRQKPGGGAPQEGGKPQPPENENEQAPQGEGQPSTAPAAGST